MVDGKFLYIGGQYHTIDIDAVMYNIQKVEELIRKEIFNEH
jgi:hypothetical protein